jgi:hypothetical protein
MSGTCLSWLDLCTLCSSYQCRNNPCSKHIFSQIIVPRVSTFPNCLNIEGPTVRTRTQSTKVIWNMCPTLITRTQSTTVIWDMCPTLITRAYTEYKCQLRHVSDGDNSNTEYKGHLKHVSDADNSNTEYKGHLRHVPDIDYSSIHRVQMSTETCVRRW